MDPKMIPHEALQDECKAVYICNFRGASCWIAISHDDRWAYDLLRYSSPAGLVFSNIWNNGHWETAEGVKVAIENGKIVWKKGSGGERVKLIDMGSHYKTELV